MRQAIMDVRISCVAFGLIASGTWAQVPVFKLWVTEVYEGNPDGFYTAKCGGVNFPTPDPISGISLPGVLIQIEVTVGGRAAFRACGNVRSPSSSSASIRARRSS